MVNFTSLLTTAQRLISENGRSITFVRYDQTDDVPTQPWKGPADPRATPDATLTVDAVFVEPDSNFLLGRQQISADLRKDVDQILMVAAGANENLGRFQEIIDETTRWKIQFVRDLRPASITVLSFVGVKQ